jgi:hypothetical protein
MPDEQTLAVLGAQGELQQLFQRSSLAAPLERLTLVNVFPICP